MNNKYFISAVIALSIILISLFLFKTPNDTKFISGGSNGITEAAFSYSGIIEDLSGSSISLKTLNGKIENLITSSSMIVKGIEGASLSMSDIKKGFSIEAVGNIKNKIQTIEKLVVIKEENIIIYSPTIIEELSSPLIIKGEARVFENTINYIILDASGRTLGQGMGITDSSSPSKFGNFTIKANFRKPKTSTGSIEVYEISEKDGSVINSSKVNIKFGTKSNSTGL